MVTVTSQAIWYHNKNLLNKNHKLFFFILQAFYDTTSCSKALLLRPHRVEIFQQNDTTMFNSLQFHSIFQKFSLLFFSPFKSIPRFYTTTSADGQTYNIATQIYMVYLTLFSSSPTVTSSCLKYLNFLRGSSNTIMTVNKLERKQCSAGECHLSTTRIAV